jgi:hypothetical protein
MKAIAGLQPAVYECLVDEVSVNTGMRCSLIVAMYLIFCVCFM